VQVFKNPIRIAIRESQDCGERTFPMSAQNSNPDPAPRTKVTPRLPIQNRPKAGEQYPSGANRLSPPKIERVELVPRRSRRAREKDKKETGRAASLERIRYHEGSSGSWWARFWSDPGVGGLRIVAVGLVVGMLLIAGLVFTLYLIHPEALRALVRGEVSIRPHVPHQEQAATLETSGDAAQDEARLVIRPFRDRLTFAESGETEASEVFRELGELYSTNPWVWLEAVQLALAVPMEQRAQFESQIETFLTRALRTGEGDPEVIQESARLMASAGYGGRAINILENAVESGVLTREIGLELLRLYEVSHQLVKAELLITRFQVALPSDPEIATARVELFMRSRQYVKALREAEVLLAKKGGNKARLLLLKAELLGLYMGKSAETVPILEGLLREGHDSRKLREILAYGYLAQKRWSQALQNFEAAEGFGGQSVVGKATFENSFALALHASGRLRAAARRYENAIATDPLHSAQAKNNLANLLLGEKMDLEKALELSRSAVDLDPNNPDYLDTLGEILLATGSPQQAMPYFERAIERSADKPNPLHYKHLGSALLKVGDAARALAPLQRAAGALPADSEAQALYAEAQIAAQGTAPMHE
jgi:tetratricopeptide (TPR) repeat protein